MTRRLLTLTAVLVFAIGTAPAEITKHFEFDSDGVLPSDDPQIAFRAATGFFEAGELAVPSKVRPSGR